jgi:hypothetical protein
MAGGSGRHLGSDLGCGSQRRSFFDSAAWASTTAASSMEDATYVTGQC